MASAAAYRRKKSHFVAGPQRDLAASGRTNREIAQTLFVTPKTVEYHLRNAYRKLDIQSRSELSRVLDG